MIDGERREHLIARSCSGARTSEEPATYLHCRPPGMEASHAIQRAAQGTREQTLAILPWGDVFADFLDPLGVSLEELFSEFVGSWMFGYADALLRAGVRTVFLCPTGRVEKPLRGAHEPTGAQILLLPMSRAARALRAAALPHRLEGRRDPASVSRAVAAHVAPYLDTPPTSLARALRNERCRAVLCQEYESARFDVCVALGGVLRLPVFGVFQGADYQTSKLERPLRPHALRRSAGLLVGPTQEASRLQELYGLPSSKIARIPNPVDVSRWRPAASPAEREMQRARLALPAEALVVAWHGQVQLHRKGLDVLLEAWKLVRGHRSDWDARLVLVGAGEDARLLGERIPPAGGIVRLDGWHGPQALRAILSAADVYAFPSRHEGLPMAPLEAMACGLPVVGSDIVGVRDVIGDCGLLVPPGDPVALAAALDGLLREPELRHSLGRRARKRAEQVFAPEIVGPRLRSLLFGPDGPC